MTVTVGSVNGEYRLDGDWPGTGQGNAFLQHLRARAFSPATIRAYAYDLTNFGRFLTDQRLDLAEVEPVDVFAWVDWQNVRVTGGGSKIVRLARSGSAPATVNRRVAAVRAFFEFLVMAGAREANPVPAPRRGQGLRPTARGMLGHLGPGRARGGGRLVREQRRLPESLELTEVQAFVAGLRSHRDRAMVLAMLLGGLRSAEVRSLRLADVDQGRRRVRVVGKGGKERVVPVDAAFFAELAGYLRLERPPKLTTPECFVVLRGPTAGAPVSEAGLRSLFRRHRETSGAVRVRPHRLRHTYGTELAAAGMDLLALRELMGHASPETTGRYVHLSAEHLAAEYAAARAIPGRCAMTVAVARVATTADDDWLTDYIDHCRTRGCSDRAVRDRLRAARALLAAHPDLEGWMRRPVQARLVELRWTKGWPLLVFLIGTGRLHLDLELAVSQHLTGLAAIVEAQHAPDFAAAREAGRRLGWTDGWVETVLGECLAVLLAWHGGTVHDLTREVLDAFDAELDQTMQLPATTRKAYRCRLASLRQVLFEVGVHDQPPRRRPWSRTLDERFAEVPMADAIRVVLLRYVQTRATVLRPRTVESLVNDLLPFAEFLTSSHPEVRTLRSLERRHIEAFLVWNRTRPWRGRKARQQPIGAAVAQSAVLTLRNLLEDIAGWGWAEAPPGRLVFAADVPKLDRPLPRALTPDVDARLMDAVEDLDDAFARTGLRVLRGTGLRVGELLDLELGAVIDYGASGSWLRVPLGKLATERLVPLDQDTLTRLDDWTQRRGAHRPIPHPRTGRATDFLFTEHGRRLGATRLRNGLLAATSAAGLLDNHGDRLTVTPHQLRHTYATSLANAGMSLQALMALLGHVTPEMTLRYATLASPTLRDAYDEAMGKMRRQLTLTPVGRPIVPDKVAWLASEMLKTRVAHGYCSRHEAQGACPYANICETCDNYTPSPEFSGALNDQLTDVQALRADAESRGWTGEAERHATIAAAIEGHLNRVQRG